MRIVIKRRTLADSVQPPILLALDNKRVHSSRLVRLAISTHHAKSTFSCILVSTYGGNRERIQ